MIIAIFFLFLYLHFYWPGMSRPCTRPRCSPLRRMRRAVFVQYLSVACETPFPFKTLLADPHRRPVKLHFYRSSCRRNRKWAWTYVAKTVQHFGALTTPKIRSRCHKLFERADINIHSTKTSHFNHQLQKLLSAGLKRTFLTLSLLNPMQDLHSRLIIICIIKVYPTNISLMTILETI